MFASLSVAAPSRNRSKKFPGNITRGLPFFQNALHVGAFQLRQSGVEQWSVHSKKVGVSSPNLTNFLHTLRNGALFNMQSGDTQLRHQRTGVRAQFSAELPLRARKLMLTQQDEAVSGMRARRKCPERQCFPVRSRPLE